MYRECDLVSDTEHNPIRITIPEASAKIGNIVKVAGNNWEVIRVHGMSFVEIPVRVLPISYRITLPKISS